MPAAVSHNPLENLCSTAALLTLLHIRFKLERYVTIAGHSLGGALATLAAYDLATELALPHVHCITFGAPRVGNSVFVSDYDRHVPDTWCLPLLTNAGARWLQEAYCSWINFLGQSSGALSRAKSGRHCSTDAVCACHGQARWKPERSCIRARVLG